MRSFSYKFALAAAENSGSHTLGCIFKDDFPSAEALGYFRALL